MRNLTATAASLHGFGEILPGIGPRVTSTGTAALMITRAADLCHADASARRTLRSGLECGRGLFGGPRHRQRDRDEHGEQREAGAEALRMGRLPQQHRSAVASLARYNASIWSTIADSVAADD